MTELMSAPHVGRHDAGNSGTFRPLAGNHCPACEYSEAAPLNRRRVTARQDRETGRTYFTSVDARSESHARNWSVSVYETAQMVDELRALGAVVEVVDSEVGPIDG